MPESNNKRHKYIASFNPDVVLMTEEYQDYLYTFNADKTTKILTNFSSTKSGKTL